MGPLRPYGWLLADPPAGVAADTSQEEARRTLLATKGPAPLAVAVHRGLRDRVDGVSERAEGLIAVSGGFEVRDRRRRARVLLTWIWSPPQAHRSWLLGVEPVHRRRRARREADLTLIAELLPHLDAVLHELVDVRDHRWLSQEEADSFEP